MKILLVDDEEMVREMARDMCRFLGHEVVIADSGEHALEIFSENKNNFNLIILDLLMPKMSGLTTFQKIREINGDVPVVLSSGISDIRGNDNLLKTGATAFLEKPYTMQGLKKTLAKIK